MHSQLYHTPPSTFKAHLLPASNNSLTLTVDFRKIFSSLGLDRKILNSMRFLIPLVNTRNKKMKSWPHSASLFLWVKPRIKWFDSDQLWTNSNIPFSDNLITPTNKIKVYVPHNFLNTNFIKRELEIGFPWESISVCVAKNLHP